MDAAFLVALGRTRWPDASMAMCVMRPGYGLAVAEDAERVETASIAPSRPAKGIVYKWTNKAKLPIREIRR